jgi:hypothetical protein
VDSGRRRAAAQALAKTRQLVSATKDSSDESGGDDESDSGDDFAADFDDVDQA